MTEHQATYHVADNDMSRECILPPHGSYRVVTDERGTRVEETPESAAARWAASPEGQAAIEASLQRADAMIAELREARKIDPASLWEPMTI